jgi:hypothetical protein
MALQRYAIYWAPEAGSPLAAFGREWLGSDPERGEPSRERETLGLDPELVERATVTPRRYGLHATMKAPFPRAEGFGEAELVEALSAFCARRRRFRTGRLRLARFGRWLALIPSAPRADLDWLAAECVTHFDRFRAPLTEEDRARRGDITDPLEKIYLEQFGYPGVLARFQFHITVAGPLASPELDAVEAALKPAMLSFTAEPFAVEELCWFGEPKGGGLFRIVSRAPLRR